MGEQADYDIERIENRTIYPFGIDVLFHEDVRDQNRKVLANYVWTTRDGAKVKFKNMALSHLLNVVKIQERGGHKFSLQLRDYYEYRATLEGTTP